MNSQSNQALILTTPERDPRDAVASWSPLRGDQLALQPRPCRSLGIASVVPPSR